MPYTKEDQARQIRLFESYGEWDEAKKLAELKLAGRPKRRVHGVTPRLDAQFQLRDRIFAAGGDIEPFLDDPLIPRDCVSEDQKCEFLERLLALEGSRLRRAHKIWTAQKNGGQKVSGPADDDISDV